MTVDDLGAFVLCSDHLFPYIRITKGSLGSQGSLGSLGSQGSLGSLGSQGSSMIPGDIRVTPLR